MVTEQEAEIIKKIFEPKQWNDTLTMSSWAVFKIMGEFVNGFEQLHKIGPCAAIFGSARTKPGTKYYEMEVETAQRLAKLGFGVITGGGPGIMEAGNKGAKKGGSSSVGLSIKLPMEQGTNKYVDYDKDIRFDYFFVRKTIFMRYAQGFIVMPGGFGTLDELMEALTLIQTNKLVDFPVVLMGKKYWAGLIDWFKTTLLEEGMISEGDFDIFHVVDTPQEAVDIIEEFYNKYRPQPNFGL